MVKAIIIIGILSFLAVKAQDISDCVNIEKTAKCEASLNSQQKQRHKLPTSLNLTVHENLLTPEECNAVRTISLPFLRPSKVGRPAKIEPSLRLAFSCKIPRIPNPLLWSVENKLARAAGVPTERGEDLQVGAYPIGHYYGMHCDERKGGRPNGGGRLATALAYLNDLDGDKVGGGHTVFSGEKMHLPGGVDFPRSDIRVRVLKTLSNSGGSSSLSDQEKATRVSPKQGRVITFRNIEAAPLNDGDIGNGKYRFIEGSTHGASPVVSLVDPPPPEGTEGTVKYVVQQWFGLKSEVNIARHPGLICHLGLGVAKSYGIDSMKDLASPNGEPLGRVVCQERNCGDGMEEMNCRVEKGGYGVVDNVPSLIPGIGATRIRGLSASVESKGQPITTSSNDSVAAGIWFMLNLNNSADSARNNQRIFRVGPHEISISKSGEVIWSVGDKSTRSTINRILPHRWYHLALSVDTVRSVEDAVILNAEIGISIPGQAPSKPLTMKIRLDTVPKWIEGISVGGCCDGDSEAEVDLTVTDFYAVREDMKGKGHTFAFAIVYYDPSQGL